MCSCICMSIHEVNFVFCLSKDSTKGTGFKKWFSYEIGR